MYRYQSVPFLVHLICLYISCPYIFRMPAFPDQDVFVQVFCSRITHPSRTSRLATSLLFSYKEKISHDAALAILLSAGPAAAQVRGFFQSAPRTIVKMAAPTKAPRT